ncbi:MAG: hypothetical protein RIQ59_277 [Bacteroidota bacterium]
MKFFNSLSYILITFLFVSCCKQNNKDFDNNLFLNYSFKSKSSKEKKQYLDSLFNVSNLKIKDSICRNFLFDLSTEYYYLNDLKKSNIINNSILKYSIQVHDSFSIGKANCFIGDSYEYSSRDSAYFYYLKAEKIYRALGLSEKIATVLFKKAYILFYEGNYVESDIQVSRALSLLKNSKNYQLVFSAFTLLGVNFEKLQDYNSALKYHLLAKKTLQKFKKNDLFHKNNYKITCSVNISNVYVKLGAFQKAIDELHSVDLKNIIHDWPNDYAAVLGNLGVAYLKIGKREVAKKYFIEAFKIAKKEKDLNIELYQYINLGEYFLCKKQYDSCYLYFSKALVHSRKLKSIDEYKLVLRYLSKVDSKKDNYYNELYIAVSDSLFKAQRKSRDKYARIEYETSVIEDENKLLSTKNTYILIVSILLIFSLVLVIVYRYIKSQKREIAFTKAQQKAEEEIFDLLKEYQLKLRREKELEQNRISKELHDSVMNKLYGARMQLGILNDSDDKEIKEKRLIYVDLLQEIEQEIRTISHDLQSEVIDNKFDYVSILFNLIQLQNEIGATLFSIEVDSKIDWNTIDSLVKITIFRIVQESLLNVTKHAKAKECKVSLSLESNHLILHIKDDGVGFDDTSNSSGIGLKNMKERISALNSKFEIFSEEKKGTLIKVVVFLN